MLFSQESGRAGRRGEKVKSTILMSNQEYKRLERCDADILTKDDICMREFIITFGCRRYISSSFIDGRE